MEPTNMSPHARARPRLQDEGGFCLLSDHECYVTEHDAQRAASDGYLSKDVYGLLAQGDLQVTGVGDASHWDRRPHGNHYSPIEGHEFVYISFYDTVYVEDSSGVQSPTYLADYERFLTMVGCAENRGEVSIALERTDDRLTGIVRETTRGEYDETDGVTGGSSQRIGEASLVLVGPDPLATFPDTQTVLREPFVFNTVVYDPYSWGYSIQRFE